MGCMDANSKTLCSVDFTTDCPLRRIGAACPYCYVEAARDANFNAKVLETDRPYNREVLRFTKAKIVKLNSLGGIRLHSFGDYIREEHRESMQLFLDDCFQVGLKVKAITKQETFLADFGDHPALSIVHLTVDNIGASPVAWDRALQLRQWYPNLRIRAVCLSDADVAAMAPWVDIVTLNHRNLGHKVPGSVNFSARHNKAKKAAIVAQYPEKVCCQTGKCSSCPIHCAA